MPNFGSPFSITARSQSMNHSELNSASSAHGMSRSDLPIKSDESNPANDEKTWLLPR